VDDLLSSSPEFVDVGASRIAYRKIGEGAPLLFIHGWPLSGATYRKIVPELAKHFTCYVIDLPGAGDTRWTNDTDFGFKGQAQSVLAFLEKLGIERTHLLAHDTGATIGRYAAVSKPEQFEKLVIIGTEIPHHRPPWIPFYQKLCLLPGRTATFRMLLRSKSFLRSNLGFGGCFEDLHLLEGEFHELFVAPLIASSTRMDGQIRYLLGIDWSVVDGLEHGHAKLTMPTLLVWGEGDTVFPLERARAIEKQLPNCKGLVAVPGAKLLVHEEKPDVVAKHALDFLALSSPS
jgi:pimeloyl-ACP methyl ester carboxylesterase